MTTLIIDSLPPIAFYDGSVIPDIDQRWRRLVRISDMRSMLRISGGETPNGSAEIDNGDGKLTDYMTGEMLRQPVRIYDGAALVFRGVIRRISVGSTITLDLEA